MYLLGYTLKSKKELLFTFLMYSIFAYSITYIEGAELLVFFSIFHVFSLMAILLGYYFKENKSKLLIFPILFSIFIFFGYKDYLSLIYGRNYIIAKQLPNISLYTSNLEETTLNQKDKVYVLDFWSTSCGVCIQKFPDFEKKVFEYKDNPNVVFYSINTPVRKENINDNIQLVKDKYNFKFNKLYAKDFSVCDSLGFNKFPTLIILKNDTIYYQGSLIFDDDITIHHIDNEIKRVLNIK